MPDTYVWSGIAWRIIGANQEGGMRRLTLENCGRVVTIWRETSID